MLQNLLLVLLPLQTHLNPSTIQSQPPRSPAGGMRLQVGESAHVRLDRVGYLPNGQKIAVLREPVVGFDGPLPFAVPAQLELREAFTSRVAFQGPITPWNGGAVHGQSGDRVWYFDFSGLTVPGEYVLFEPGSSEPMQGVRIADDVYHDVAEQAVRAFYYQRCGVAKHAAHGGNSHADGSPCHVGTGQDLLCRSILDPVGGAVLDLSGGWHDAGDYNKYVTFATHTLSALLDGYEAGAHVLGDDLGIPESGNGVPDYLDELRYELEWLLRMQLPDGSVLHKVSVTGFQSASPPSADGAARFYGPPTASATISACGVLAHAARVFGGEGSPGSLAFAAQMRGAAESAWDWLEANPSAIPSNYDNMGFSSVAAELSPYTQEMRRLYAAAELLHLTGEVTYRGWFDSRYQNSHLFQWNWASPFEMDGQEALWAYLHAPLGSAVVKGSIRMQYGQVLSGAGQLGQWNGQVDAYRAPMGDQDHVWGNNAHKASSGSMFQQMLRLGLDPSNHSGYRNAAAGYLHYLHGVNPLGFCYLTNLDGLGVVGSVREMYHGWFAHGTVWDNADQGPGPAPGFVVGGVNPNFAPDPSYSGPALVPPQSQPILKSYLDWNTGWPQNSWELSEPAIGYQAQYIRLLASFL